MKKSFLCVFSSLSLSKNPRYYFLLQNPFAIDLRSLALFRIVLGLLILMDLFIRTQDLRVHYTDAGMFPREALGADYWNYFPWIFYYLSGSTKVVAFLFVTASIFAVCLVL